MKIPDNVLASICHQVKLKDQAAYALGVALVEYELEKIRLEKPDEVGSTTERLLRLGALQSEFDKHRDMHMKIVVKATAHQAALGEKVLKDLGLPKDRVFIIDQRNGEVLELKAGQYVPVVEGALQ